MSSSVEPGTLPSQEMVGPEAARDGDTASPYGTKRKEREVSPSVGIAAVIAMNIKVHGYRQVQRATLTASRGYIGQFRSFDPLGERPNRPQQTWSS